MKHAIPIKPFYMMRHGETVANVEGYAAGSLDTPLTEKGKAQALGVRPIVEALSPRPTLIVHSTLSRARDTAKIINESLKLPMVEQASIVEQSFGGWMGQPWEKIREPIMRGEIPPNGESMDMLAERVVFGLEEILSMFAEPVLIVSHGGIFDALLWQYGCTLEDVKNCYLYEFAPSKTEYAFPWQIWHHNLSEDQTLARKQVVCK